MVTIIYILMATQTRHHKKAKLQYNSNRYYITIPPWFVKKVLCAKKGDVIIFDHRRDEIILKLVVTDDETK